MKYSTMRAQAFDDDEVNIETERKPKTRTTEITADEFYVAVLSNEAKVVLAKFKA